MDDTAEGFALIDTFAAGSRWRIEFIEHQRDRLPQLVRTSSYGRHRLDLSFRSGDPGLVSGHP